MIIGLVLHLFYVWYIFSQDAKAKLFFKVKIKGIIDISTQFFEYFKTNINQKNLFDYVFLCCEFSKVIL